MDQCEATTTVGGKFRRCERPANHPLCLVGRHVTTFGGKEVRFVASMDPQEGARMVQRIYAQPTAMAVALPAPVPVLVDWRDTRHDWHWFTLLGFAGEWARLQGRDADDGSPYTGGPIWVHTSEIEWIEEVER